MLSALALILLAPVLLVIAIAIILDTGLPVFYRQDRVGLHFHVFKILKFRSMHQNNGGSLITISGDPRVTGVGKILRITKLDELPQFWNVLLGDMSLVGPRPETPEFVALYDATERRVLEVRPGLVGPSTLAFMDEAAMLAEAEDAESFYRTFVVHERVRLDLGYLEERSVAFDLRLLLRQAAAILVHH